MSSEERNENAKSNTKTVAQSFEVEIKIYILCNIIYMQYLPGYK